MKIIEKKCPNCGANLEYKVGERDVKCSKCRSSFAVEYDHNILDPEVQLKAKDLQLKILEDFDRGRKISKIIMPIFIGIFVICFIVALIMIIRGAIKVHEGTERINTEYVQSQQDYEEHRAMQEQMEKRVYEMIDEQAERMNQGN